jgi:hypothetical protein
VGGNNGGNGLVDGLLAMLLWNQTDHAPNGGKQNGLTETSAPTESVSVSEERMRVAHATQTSDTHSPVVVDFPLETNIS